MAILFKINDQVNLIVKMIIIFKAYQASQMDEEHQLNIHYKFAVILAMLSVISPFLITFSSVMSLKYANDHYGVAQMKSYGPFKACFNYAILSFLGVALLVIPLSILDILRVIVSILAVPMSLCGYEDPVQPVT